MAIDDSGVHQAKAITDRIRRVELARSLAQNGKIDEALRILQRVRARYHDEPDMQRQVDRLIERVHAGKGGAPL